MTHSRAEITRLLEEHGLSPRRAFGQNFVADPNTVRRIARMPNVGPDDHDVEIGAGLGSLTLALAESGARITAIEVDHGVAPVLRDVVRDTANVSVIEADARERANRAPREPQRLAAMREDWLRWNESMLPIPLDASISLGYGVRDIPQR